MAWHNVLFEAHNRSGKTGNSSQSLDRCELLLLVATCFSSADVCTALKCSVLRPKLGGQNKRLQKENALFVINAGHWQSCPAVGTAKLEVSIFQALHINAYRIDFNVLLPESWLSQMRWILNLPRRWKAISLYKAFATCIRSAVSDHKR
jgi:hypothetical protein